ncbi:MAG: histidine phosphatase family protein [Lachnospiraceae bacterium]
MWNRSEDQINLVLIRHGATKGNKEHRYIGITDECLSREGRDVLEKARQDHVYPMVDRVFCSPMKRCIQTAKILYPQLKPEIITEWSEIHFGDFEGKNYLDLQYDRRYQEWIESKGELSFPNGESRQAFMERCVKGLRKVVADCSVMDRFPHETTWALVIHGGTIMSLLSRFCGGEYFDYQVENGKGYLCRLYQHGEEFEIKIERKI